MKTIMTKSKLTQIPTVEQTHGKGLSKQVSTSMAKHDDIANRSYEIYLKHGNRQGQSEQNWHQAEHELRNENIEANMQR